MWRAFFFAVGIMFLIVGIECMLIDSATIGQRKTETVQVAGGLFQQTQPVAINAGGKIISPPDWMPWSFLFTGGVVVLYALSLPGKWSGTNG